MGSGDGGAASGVGGGGAARATSRGQRVGVLVGAVVGLLFGLVFFSGDGRSALVTAAFCVLFALVAGAIGYYAARSTTRT